MRAVLTLVHMFVLVILAIVLCVHACVLFSGCASVPRTRYEEDKQLCWSSAKVQARPHGLTAMGRVNDPVREEAVERECMKARGWE